MFSVEKRAGKGGKLRDLLTGTGNEKRMFLEKSESRSSPPPAIGIPRWRLNLFREVESSVSHFFEKCLLLQATGIVAFKIVLTYLSWNIEVKQSNWEYTTMPLLTLAASEELSLFLDLKEQALDECGYFFSSHAFMDDWFWLGVLLLRFSSSVLIFCAVFARCV